MADNSRACPGRGCEWQHVVFRIPEGQRALTSADERAQGAAQEEACDGAGRRKCWCSHGGNLMGGVW